MTHSTGFGLIGGPPELCAEINNLYLYGEGYLEEQDDVECDDFELEDIDLDLIEIEE